MKAILVLEDGSSYEGVAIGASGQKTGEVILNTAVVGYQEMMTDPANAGKILVLTYPLIGNYGVAGKFYESKKCWIAGLVIKEASRIYSNWQAEASFDEFLKKENVVAIGDVDTRTLAVNIREKGEMRGIIAAGSSGKNNLSEMLKKSKKDEARDFIKEISVKRPLEIKTGLARPNIAILDLGVLNSFIRQLKTLGCNITLLPFDTPPENILTKFDALIVSNGPEEDISIPVVVKTVKNVLGRIPLLGISTGHEVIGLALGGKLKKMKTGHHGVNYPVIGPDSYKGEITVQNHSFVIDDSSIKAKNDISITLRNLNDKTIEEMESKALKFISTQFYPASPGFEEINEVFGRFLKMAQATKNPKRKHTSSSHGEVQHAKT